ncbi:hypothetical protein GLA29479_2414 [Lysobacter antibioticus]|uniref:Uncharacterized protein n=1 Tax=Lysobacter antibioticus TaxID=84531 RepID=A0A0S2DXH6_LYSAN|nr:hypothetical protein GLA29479_2414 [Lysobacter antibioticus]ALN81510.1 hypothetical protein LA76x_3384 [Lysobacter antibioticus]
MRFSLSMSRARIPRRTGSYIGLSMDGRLHGCRWVVESAGADVAASENLAGSINAMAAGTRTRFGLRRCDGRRARAIRRGPMRCGRRSQGRGPVDRRGGLRQQGRGTS